MRSTFSFFFLCAICCCSVLAEAQTIIRVKPGGSGNGSSWAVAAGNLQQVLAQAPTNTEIWVAAGIYTPTTCISCSSADRQLSFAIPSGVKVFGGFSGSETSLSQRDILANPTILSGNIDQDSSITRNSYHIVSFREAVAGTRLDGFTIREGHANGGGEAQHGAAIYNDGSGTGKKSKPTIDNCIFLDNIATGNGGAIYNNGFYGEANAVIDHCTFTNNRAREGGAIMNQGFSGESSPQVFRSSFQQNQSGGGGAIYNSGNSGKSNGHYESCHFKNNVSTSYGGAIYNFARDPQGVCSPTMVNCIFASNTGDGAAGAVYTLASNSGLANPRMAGCVVYDNFSRVGGGVYVNASDNGSTHLHISNTIFSANRAGFDKNLHFSGNSSPAVTLENVLIDAASCATISGASGGVMICNAGTLFNVAAGFVAAAAGDFHLVAGSAGIDAGLSSAFTALAVSTDFAGNPRIQGLQADMGAYEFSTGDSDGDGIPDVSDNCPSVANANQLDADGDGFGAACDCDDANPAITVGSTFYADTDGDTYGNPAVTLVACTQPTGFAIRAGDCNDTDATIHPGAIELCDGIDNNCNGQIDEGVIDTIPPVIVCRNISISVPASGAINILPDDVYASGNDNCGSVTLVSVLPNSFLLPGTYTVVLTARDDANNSTSCTASVVVTAAPVLSGSYCSAKASEPWTEWVARVKLANLDNSSSKCGTTCGYSDFTSQIAHLETGNTYSLSLTPGLSWAGYQPSLYWRVWIDWNQDGDFADAGETVAQSDGPFTVINSQLTVPSTALVGGTRMRVALRRDLAPAACTNFIPGEVEDYTVQVIAGGPQVVFSNCPNSILLNVASGATGAVASWTAPTAATTCNAGTATLTRTLGLASGSIFPLGISTVRYVATDSCANTDTCQFTVNVVAAPAVITLTCPASQSITLPAGQTSSTATWALPTASSTCTGTNSLTRSAGPAPGSTFNLGVTTITYLATDGCGGMKTCSFTITVLPASTGGGSYCMSGASEPWTEWIANVKISNVDNASSKCDTRCGYGDFTNQIAALTAGASASITLTPGLSWPGHQPDLFWRVYIDWNADGDFLDAGETVASVNSGNQIATSTFTVPIGAAGLTRMRISMQTDAYAQACGNFVKGEVEDYQVLVSAAPAPLLPLKFASQHPEVIDLKVWPNPASERLHLSYSGEVNSISLLSSTGILLRRLCLRESSISAKPEMGLQELEIADLAPGLYLLVAEGIDGHREVVKVSIF